MNADFIKWPSGAYVHRLANIVGDDVEIGENSRIDPFVTITGKVRIGKSVHIAVGVGIFGVGGVEIGDFCGIGSGVKIFTASDGNPLDDEYVAQRTHKPVYLGARSLIGTNVVIVPGTHIGERTQIGALSLAKGVLNDDWLYVGVPAKPLRARKP